LENRYLTHKIRHCTLLPEFNKRGYLPPGLYRSDFTEVQRRFGNTDRRQELSKLFLFLPTPAPPKEGKKKFEQKEKKRNLFL
jgi:hypothetical protein